MNFDPRNTTTARFFAEGARESVALSAIGTCVQAAGYTCSHVRDWHHDTSKLECVFDLYIDDVSLGEMAVSILFGEGDSILSVDGAFGKLLDLRGQLDG